MIKFVSFFLFLVGIITFSLPASGQVILADPLFPSASDSVRIIFNAAQGSMGLKGFTGPVYAHTGVITSQSSSGSDWRHTIAGWSTNTEKARLNPLGNDLWELKIGPSIRGFYGVPANIRILKLAFVFRNSDGSKTGRMADGQDIFQDVYEEGLNLILLQPSQSFLVVDAGQEIQVQATSSGSDSIVMVKDGAWLARSLTNELNHWIVAEEEGLHSVSLTAYAGEETARDSFQYFIKGDDYVRELPAGARDGINYPNANSALLVLFAPEKDHVFLTGDFNNWSIDPDFLMFKTPDQQRFWFLVENLEPGKEYIFQYLIDGELRIADPYTNKTSDPWWDHLIGSAVYPGLIPYPAGKTTQIASVLQTEKPAYQWKINDFQRPEPSKLVIYELLMRDFTHCHTFRCMLDTLDYLKNLGVNVIELMPINEFVANDSWGYNSSFYFAPDKYYGPENDFKAFIDACHERGMAVVIDMVLNHSYEQSPMVRMYFDGPNDRPAANNPWFNVQSPNNEYSWGYDFNHESIHTQQFVDSVNAFWLKEFKVDGFRFDFTKGFTNVPGNGGGYDASRIRLLKRMFDRIREVDQSAYVILEHFADNREERELSTHGMMLWGNINYNYRKASSGYFLDGKSDFSWISWKKRGWTDPHLVGYMESHDEERLMYECYYWGNNQNPEYNIKDTTTALKRMELDANFFIPVPGPKMIWMFGELGYDFSINHNGRVGRKPIRWDYYGDERRKRLYQVYSALSHLKVNHPVFSTTDYTIDAADTVKRIQLTDASMNVTILGNYGIRLSRGVPDFQHTGWWYEYWTGDSLQVNDVATPLWLLPGEYRLYTNVRLKKPDIISSVDPRGSVMSEDNARLDIYPNPAGDHCMVRVPQGDRREGWLIYRSMTGSELGRVRINPEQGDEWIRLDISGLEQGIYMLEWQDDRAGYKSRRHGRFIRMH